MSSFKNFSIRLALVAALLFSAPSSGFAQEDNGRTAGKQPVQEKGNHSDTYRQLNLFGDVFERVRAQYVEPVEDKELIEKAINGMLTSLDPHSAYLNEESFGEMQVKTKGEFGGLGIEVTMENGLVKVVSPIDDTPAFRAGIQAGDYITKIDNEPVMGLTLNEAVDKMRGEVGTEIHLEVARESSAEPLPFTIVRDIIRIQSVRFRTEGNAGYIRIAQFNQNTETGLKQAVDEIKKELGSKLIGFVLDLRDNPGGLLDQAIAVSDAFLDKGEIVSTRGRDDRDTKRDNATSGDIADNLPIIVLINGGSASASEIVAGALQDHKRAIVLGQQSFGKGSVQTVIPLSGYGAMKLTTARYYTPSGRSIQAEGIKPDIDVEPAKIESYGNSPYGGMREADLRGALKNDQTAGKKEAPAKKEEPAATPDAAATPESDAKTPAKKGEGEEKDPVDYQLLRALDLINGLSLYQGSAIESKQGIMPAKDAAPAAAAPDAAPAEEAKPKAE